MRGTYNFYEKGNLIGSSSNIITDSGRKAILRFLAGRGTTLGRRISVGAGDDVAQVTDTALTLEFDSANVDVSSPNYNEQNIIFKGTLNSTSVGRIYEVGLWELAGSGTVPSTVLTFDKTAEGWTVGTSEGEFSRLGPTSLLVAAATNGSATSVANFTTLDSYSMDDVFTVGYWCNEENVSSLTLRFRTANVANYYEVTLPGSRGYQVGTFTKSSLIKVGSPSFADVTQVEVKVNAKATDTAVDNGIFPNGLGYTGARVSFDSLTVLPKIAIDAENTLISRSVIGGFIQKTADRPLDIEYVLDVSI